MINRTWEAPDHRALSGTTVVLEPIDPKRHTAALFEATHGSPEREGVWRYMGQGPFPDREAMREWLATEMTNRSDPLTWAVVAPDERQAVGMVAILNIAPAHGRAEIGHVLFAKAAQRTKANTETQYLLLRHLFDDKGYRRVEWKCNANNAASRYAAARLGFLYEGRFRQHQIVKGVNRDTDWFAMTDKDWPRCKGNLERYLESETLLSLYEMNNG